MQDRLSEALWLEATDLGADEYRSSRAPLVQEVPGVQRGSLWANERPGRDEFPRSMPEFGLLAVWEVTSDFQPPAATDQIRGMHFRRHPRPSQGRLTGRPTLGLLIVLISPRRPEEAQALRDWGDFVHLRHIAEAAVPGYTTITAYERATEDGPRYLHLYEMDTDDPEAAFQSMTPLVAERLGPGSQAFERWALTPELRIDYVNTFRRLDVIPSGAM